MKQCGKVYVMVHAYTFVSRNPTAPQDMVLDKDVVRCVIYGWTTKAATLRMVLQLRQTA